MGLLTQIPPIPSIFCLSHVPALSLVCYLMVYTCFVLDLDLFTHVLSTICVFESNCYFIYLSHLNITFVNQPEAYKNIKFKIKYVFIAKIY